MIKYKQEGRGAELHLDYHLPLNQRRQVILATALEAEMIQDNYPDSAKVIRDTAKKVAGVK